MKTFKLLSQGTCPVLERIYLKALKRVKNNTEEELI